MIWIRLVIILLAVISLVYYAMVLLQCFDVIQFTKRKMTFNRMVFPFYYWIAPMNEKPSKKHKK